MPSVAVVGSVNLDLVATCERLPKPGETLSATTFDRYPGGKGANQALAAHRSGASTTLFAAVGDDADAEAALAILRADGVGLEQVSVVAEPTGMALITVDSGGENQIIVVPAANYALTPSAIEVAGFDAVLCQLEIPMDCIAAAASSSTGLFCLNTAPAAPIPRWILESCDLLIMNETERELLGKSVDQLDALVVVTLGARGAIALRDGEPVAEATPPEVDIVDTVGAGDAFCGTLVVELAEGNPLDQSLGKACAAGALAATRSGAQPSLPSRTEIERIMAR